MAVEKELNNPEAEAIKLISAAQIEAGKAEERWYYQLYLRYWRNTEKLGKLERRLLNDLFEFKEDLDEVLNDYKSRKISYEAFEQRIVDKLDKFMREEPKKFGLPKKDEEKKNVEWLINDFVDWVKKNIGRAYCQDPDAVSELYERADEVALGLEENALSFIRKAKDYNELESGLRSMAKYMADSKCKAMGIRLSEYEMRREVETIARNMLNAVQEAKSDEELDNRLRSIFVGIINVIINNARGISFAERINGIFRSMMRRQ